MIDEIPHVLIDSSYTLAYKTDVQSHNCWSARAVGATKEGRMVRRLVVVAVVAVSLAVVGTLVIAQQAKAPAAPKPAAATDMSQMPLVGVTVMQIKPDLLTEWQDFQKNEVIPTLQKAGIRQRTGIATAVGPSFEYVFLTPIANMAERDGDSPIVKALGQDGARAYGQKARRFVASQRTYVVRLRTDLSYQPDPNAHLPLAVVSNYSIAAGRAAEFENYLKTDVTPAHKQLKTGGFVVYQGLFGGDGSAFVVATMLHNFAEVDQGPAIVRAYGQARANAILQKLSGIVTHVERTISREVPELTFRPQTTSENR
jgi:hypothetical protein